MKCKLLILCCLIAVFAIFLTVPAAADCDDCIASEDIVDWNNHCEARCGCVYERCRSCDDPDDTYLSFYCDSKHYYDDEVSEEPTCSDKGERVFTCRYCYDEYAVDIPALGHSFTSQVVSYLYLKAEATCYSSAEYYYSCSRCSECSDSDYFEHGSPLSHRFSVTNSTAPTCLQSGQNTLTCRECYQIEYETIDALGHVYSAVITPSTCAGQGYTTYTCSRSGCGDSYKSDYTAALGHSFVDGTCATCGAEDPDYVSPVCDHKWEITSTTGDVCINGLTVNKRCNKCGIIDSVFYEATGHAWNGAETTPPTCTTSGYTVDICNECGYELVTDEKPATGHYYIPTVVPPTCTEAGYTMYNCSKLGCDASYQDDPVSPTNHPSRTTTVIPSTCTTPGSKNIICDDCKFLLSSESIQATGHKYVDGICSACQATSTCQHTYVETLIPPTCADPGYSIFACSKCGDFYTGNNVNVLDHSWLPVNQEAAACGKNGYINYTCNREGCGATKVDVIVALPHNWDPIGTVIGEDNTSVVTFECTECKIKKTEVIATAAAQAQNWLLTAIRGFSGALIQMYETVANGVEIGGVTLEEVIAGCLILVVMLCFLNFAGGWFMKK